MFLSTLPDTKITMPSFLSDGGEMGSLIRSADWSKSPLGTPDVWPQSLRTAVRIMLDSPSGMYIAWGKEYIQLYNDGYRPILGATKHPAALGDSSHRTFAEIWPTIGPMFERVMRGVPVGFPDFVLLLNRNGYLEECVFDFSYSPIRLDDGEVGGVLVTVIETTEKVRAEKALKESEQQLLFAIEAAELGTWDFNPQTGKLVWSSKAKELFGLPPEAEVNYDIYVKGLHPDDRERCNAATEKAMDPRGGGLYENEYRTIGIADGKLRWIRSKGKINFDAEGKPVRFTGVTQDITRQKEILASLQLQSLVLERMDEGVSVSDENGIILLTNSAEDEMFGYKAGELVGKHVTVQNAYQQDENEKIVTDVITALKQKGFWSGEWHNRKKDGTPFYTHSFISSLVIDGKTLFVCVQRDITVERAAHEKLTYRTALLEAQNEAIPDAILVVDTKGKMLSFNHQFVTLWKIPQEIIDRKDDAAALEFAMSLLTDPQGFIQRVNYCYTHPEEKAHEEVLFKDGRIIERYGNAVLGEDGKGYGWAWYFRDITERKKIEEKVKESEERFRSLADESPMFVFIIEPNADATISYWNKTWLTYTGQTTEEALGRAWDGIIHPDDVPIVLKFYVPQFEKQEAYFIPFVRVKRFDGEYRWHTFKGTPRYLADGVFNGYVGVGFDIHEQKLVEEALKESEERFRSLGNSIPQLAWMANAGGEIYWYNQRWFDYTGTSFEEVQGWGWKSVHHPDLVEGVERDFKNAIAKGEPYDDTFLLRSKEGEYRWFLTRAVPIRNANSEVVQWFGTNTDVSVQREVEEALKSAKEQLELTFQNVPSAIYHFDKNGRILYLNAKAANQMGYDTVEDVLAEQDVFQLRKKLDETFIILDEGGKALPIDQSSAALTFKTGKGAEVVSEFIHRKSGSSFWLLSKSSPLYNEKAELVIVLTTSTDITLQKTSEKAIRESEDRFRTMAETLPQMIWVRNMDGTIEYASKSWEDYTGINDISEAWKKMTHPDDWEPIMAVWQNAFTTGSSFQYEARIKNKEGEYRWHYGVGEPVRDKWGKLVKYIGALTDIHVQKTFAENLEELVAERTKELERSNEDLQQFAHVASHDLKEPVRKVRTFGSRLEEEFGDLLPEKGKLYLDKMQGAAERMFGLIDGVLNYSTINSLESSMETVDLNIIIKNIETDLEVVLQQTDAQINKEVLPTVQGSSVLLNQLFYNLINNALKFCREGVPSVVSINSKKLKCSEITEVALSSVQKDFVQIKICDNGIGFSQEYAERIFKTFTRLNSRDKYEGTGHGLALCRKIAERHGGYIYATAKEGAGACFYVLLPV